MSGAQLVDADVPEPFPGLIPCGVLPPDLGKFCRWQVTIRGKGFHWRVRAGDLLTEGTETTAESAMLHLDVALAVLVEFAVQ